MGGWGLPEGAGMGGGATQRVRENNIPFEGPNMTVVEIMHQFIMYILKVVQPGRGRRSVERGGGRGKEISNSLTSHRC